MMYAEYDEDILDEEYEKEEYGYDPYGEWDDAGMSVGDFING